MVRLGEGLGPFGLSVVRGVVGELACDVPGLGERFDIFDAFGTKSAHLHPLDVVPQVVVFSLFFRAVEPVDDHVPVAGVAGAGVALVVVTPEPAGFELLVVAKEQFVQVLPTPAGVAADKLTE